MEAIQYLTEQFPNADFDWLNDDAIRILVDAFQARGDDLIRFVGGCVRDSLLGQSAHDIDIATLLPPDQVTNALHDSGIKVVATGIEHGTVTAVVKRRGFEITTLRADVSTDGRRADVVFTNDWSVDARRRDFTMNAIYLSPAGVLFDPVGGIVDLKAGNVRFIGDARARIREDYLRILRFFRFSGRFANEFQSLGLSACHLECDGISNLSGERIGREMLSILSLPNAADIVAKMMESDVLEKIYRGDANVDALRDMQVIEQNCDAVLALAALFGNEFDNVADRLVLSNAEKAIGTFALENVNGMSPVLAPQDLRARVYRLGQTKFCDAALLAAAHQTLTAEEYQRQIAYARNWQPPVFSVTGNDIAAAGIDVGPKIGMILRSIEAQWISEDFPDAQRLREIVDIETAGHNRR